MRKLAVAMVLLLGCSSEAPIAGEPSSDAASTDLGVADTATIADTAEAAVDAHAQPETTLDAPVPDETASAKLPADILDLTKWKLTLPIGSPGTPTEIEQPALATYTIDPWFRLDAARTAVLFRAHCDGVTTSGSKYPRSELREMIDGGKTRASWSTTAGRHRMVVREAVIALPGTLKPQVVTAQIHDDADDVVMVRAEKEPKTGVIVLRASYPKSDGTNGTIPLLASYVLGTPFVIEIVAEKGTIDVSLDGVKKGSFSRSTTGCYFKAGCYTQSNVKDVGETKDAYGEVAIFSITLEHS